MKAKLPLGALLGLAFFSSLVAADSSGASGTAPEPAPVSAQNAPLSPSSPALLGFKFAPPATPSPSPPTSDLSFPAPDDLGEIVKMPKLIVVPRSGFPQERELLTNHGRLELAKKRFTPPLYRATLGPLSQLATYYFNFLSILGGWHPNDAEALTLYAESERVQRLHDFDDLVSLEEFDDARTGAELRQLRPGVWRTGYDSLYWNPSAARAGIHFGPVK